MADSVAISAPNRLAVQFRERYTLAKSTCERPEVRAALERALAEVAGSNLKLHLELLPDLPSESPPAAPPADPRESMQRMFEKAQTPFARRAIELFQARPARLES